MAFEAVCCMAQYKVGRQKFNRKSSHQSQRRKMQSVLCRLSYFLFHKVTTARLTNSNRKTISKRIEQTVQTIRCVNGERVQRLCISNYHCLVIGRGMGTTVYPSIVVGVKHHLRDEWSEGQLISLSVCLFVSVCYVCPGLKRTKFDSWCLFIHLSVRLFVS